MNPSLLLPLAPMATSLLPPGLIMWRESGTLLPKGTRRVATL